MNADVPTTPPLSPEARGVDASRRRFLKTVGRKAVYVAPVVVVLGANSEALANSNDGIDWSQCASFGDPCGGATCCPGYACNGAFMCEPMME